MQSPSARGRLAVVTLALAAGASVLVGAVALVGELIGDDASPPTEAQAAGADSSLPTTEGDDGTSSGRTESGRSGDGSPPTSRAPATTSGSTLPPETTVLEPLPPYAGWVDPASAGRRWSDTVPGVLTFRGNPTRSFYGSGPVPTAPTIGWRYPGSGGLCSESSTGGETRVWCGTGWTGQPAIWEREGRTWVAFGAYDRQIHFLDADTGEQLLDPFPTGDIIKGTVTVDPDGFPLLYTGSRDGFFRVLALDRPEPLELWRLSADAVPGTKWNDDWDGSALVIDDYLFEGGENSIFHIVKLNRAYDQQGLVTVDPELVFHTPGYDDELIAAVGNNVSIENSVAVSGNTVYFANSGGLVQGWDITGLDEGVTPTRTLRFWAGDDIDASIVIDEEGYLYVGVEYERGTERSREVGQIIKLDPRRPEDPLVWSVPDMERLDGGIWATPALSGELLVVPTDGGRLLGIDRRSGAIRWEKRLPGPLWMSPAVVDEVLIMGDCSGRLHAFDLSEPEKEPPTLWSVELGGCLESTPAVWGGRIVVGSRNGAVYQLSDK